MSAFWCEHYANEAAARSAIIEETRSWVGTPWAHAHDLKGGAVDCAMLLVRVHVDRKIVEPFDPRPYPSQWFLHHDASRFLEIMQRCGGRPVERALPGDIAMYNFGKHPAHGAVLIDDNYMVHASRPSGRVIIDARHSMPEQFAGFWSVFHG